MADRSIRPIAASARRSTGLLIAAAFALIAAGVILFVFVGNHTSGPGTAIPGSFVDIGKAPDTSNSSGDQIQATTASRVQFADKNDSTRLACEFSFDRADPVSAGYYTLTAPRSWLYMKDGRIMHIRADNGRIHWPGRNSGQPPESGEFRGNVIVRLFPPPTFLPGGAIQPIDPEKDAPSVLAVTESVAFDSVLLELTTQDPIEISAKNMLFQGEGLRVVVNQVKERIESLKTKGKFVRYNPAIKSERPAPAVAGASPAPATTNPVTPAPGTPASKPADVAAATTPAPSGTSVVAIKPPAIVPPREQLYRAVFGDEVTVTQTTRKLTADTLEIFARLIDNQIPDNAFGSLTASPAVVHTSAATPSAQVAAAATPSPAPAFAPADLNQITVIPDGAAALSAPASVQSASAPAVPLPPTSGHSLFLSGPEDIVMNWAGQLVLTPIPEGPTPTELDHGNHFAARFSADKQGGATSVVLTDSSNHSRGECARIEYAATTRTLALLSGPAVKEVRFEAPDSGLLTAPSARIDLGTGIANIPGGGQLLAMRNGGIAFNPQAGAVQNDKPMPADQLRQITWTDQADFRFRTSNGKISGALDWAQFKGTVLARDHTSSIGGDTLTADFAPIGKQVSAVKHLKVEGNVLAIAGQPADPTRAQPSIDPYITCDRFEVDFAPSKVALDEMDPSMVIAAGAVKAADKTSALRAGRLEIAMGRDPKKPTDLVALDVHAVGGVQIDRVDGISTRSDTLRASPLLRTAQLLGEQVSIGRGPSTITCKRADLDDAAGTMIVYGEGAFEHIQSESAQLADASGLTPVGSYGPNSSRITATWTKGMQFDNIGGTLQCSGDAVVIAASPLSTQKLRSEKLNLWLTPDKQVETRSSLVSPASSGPMVISDNRRLLRAEAIGASEEREGAPNATVEVRRYAPPAENAGERVLEQVFWVEGPRVIADDTKGTIDIPAPGRALVYDQRAANTQSQLSTSTGLPLASGGMKGTSRFTWAGTMNFLRTSGVLSMKKDVVLEHRPAGSTQVTIVNAQQMDATLNLPAEAKSSTGVPRTTELVRAEATGAVYAESGQQRLIADSFIYNAQAGNAEATAAPGNRVTLYDDRKGGQIVARKLFWDLIKDRVEILEPAPITAPR